MTRSALFKLVITVAGLVIWVVGAKNDDATVRWAGIALIAFAFVLRFLKRPE